jgi:hypothetical protein
LVVLRDIPKNITIEILAELRRAIPCLRNRYSAVSVFPVPVVLEHTPKVPMDGKICPDRSTLSGSISRKQAHQRQICEHGCSRGYRIGGNEREGAGPFLPENMEMTF